MSQNELISKTTKIANFKDDTGRVSVRFKVIQAMEQRVVASKKTGRRHLIGEFIVADESGRILMTLWNEDADAIEEGSTYLLIDGRVQVYDHCMRLGKGLRGRFESIEDDGLIPNTSVDMSKPFMGKETKKRRRTTSQGRTFYGIPGRRTKGYCTDKDF